MLCYKHYFKTFFSQVCQAAGQKNLPKFIDQGRSGTNIRILFLNFKDCV